jgi:hypothetical protein
LPVGLHLLSHIGSDAILNRCVGLISDSWGFTRVSPPCRCSGRSPPGDCFLCTMLHDALPTSGAFDYFLSRRRGRCDSVQATRHSGPCWRHQRIARRACRLNALAAAAFTLIEIAWACFRCRNVFAQLPHLFKSVNPPPLIIHLWQGRLELDNVDPSDARTAPPRTRRA